MEKLCWNAGHHKIYLKNCMYVLEIFNNNKHMIVLKSENFVKLIFTKTLI